MTNKGIKDMELDTKSRDFWYITKDENPLSVNFTIMVDKKNGIEVSLDLVEPDLSWEQLEDIMQKIGEEAYKMGLEDRDTKIFDMSNEE